MTEPRPITIACVPEPYPAITNVVVQLQKDMLLDGVWMHAASDDVQRRVEAARHDVSS